MSAAALTPRVRSLVVCDEAIRSDIEDGVFTLEGVRQRIDAPSFPCRRTLSVYLLLSYPRPGKFHGHVRVIDEEEDKALRIRKFVAAFDEGAQPLALFVDLDECVFPVPRVYTIRVEFTSTAGDNVLKGETYFPVRQREE